MYMIKGTKSAVLNDIVFGMPELIDTPASHSLY